LTSKRNLGAKSDVYDCRVVAAAAVVVVVVVVVVSRTTDRRRLSVKMCQHWSISSTRWSESVDNRTPFVVGGVVVVVVVRMCRRHSISKVSIRKRTRVRETTKQKTRKRRI